MSSSELPQLSFVVPVFNEEPNLPVMAERLLAAGRDTGRTFEIIFVNDGSSDGTEKVLMRLQKAHPEISPVHLSRNFGHMSALTAGLEHARGTGAVVCLDGDGQHPPELIGGMVTLWESGVDVVQMVRTETQDSSVGKKVTSRGFYAVMNFFSGLQLVDGAADFRLLDRQVVDALNSLPERERFIRGLVFWVGYKRAYIPFEAPSRMAGVSKYNLRKMFAFAIGGITSFSDRPLRLSVWLAAIFSMLAACYAAFVLYARISGMEMEYGWASVILVSLILGAVQLLTIGIASEYLARLYNEVKHRPTYLTRTPRGNTEDD